MTNTENLKPWNGITPSGRQMPYDYSNLYTDSDGNIYYMNSVGEVNIWCGVSRLENHVHRLQQIAERK